MRNPWSVRVDQLFTDHLPTTFFTVQLVHDYLFKVNAVYFRQGLTCTIGLTNDLIDGGQPRAKTWFGFALRRWGLALGWPPSIKSLVNPRLHVTETSLNKLREKIRLKCQAETCRDRVHFELYSPLQLHRYDFLVLLISFGISSFEQSLGHMPIESNNNNNNNKFIDITHRKEKLQIGQ